MTREHLKTAALVIVAPVAALVTMTIAIILAVSPFLLAFGGAVWLWRHL